MAAMLVSAPWALGLQMHAAQPGAPAARAAVRAAPLVMQVDTQEKTLSVSDMSAQMREARERLENDEQTKLYMQALRGSNMNDDDQAASTTELKVVEAKTSGTHCTTGRRISRAGLSA